LQIIAETCGLDIELYGHACAIFERQIAQCRGFARAQPAKARHLPRSTV
jgi:hypothetical protein